jgi:hypothetical protein
VVPGEPEFVAHIADHFMENLPQHSSNMDVPDQASNVGSVAHNVEGSGAASPPFIQGQQQSSEINMTKVMQVPPEPDAVTQDMQTVSRQPSLPFQAGLHQSEEDVDSEAVRFILQKLCASVQIKLHTKVQLDATAALTHLSFFVPGMPELILALPQPEAPMQRNLLEGPQTSSCDHLE